VKSTKILSAAAITLALICSGCGASDSVKSITLTGTGTGSLFEVYGEGGNAQLTVTANYNSGKQVDVTAQSTFVATAIGVDQDGNALPDPYTAYAGFSSTPPTTISISNTGLITAIQPFICTYVVTSPQGTTPVTYALSGSYQIQATYKGMASNYQFLPVASASTDSTVTGATCGPLP
jgi:hypothetical protein